MIGLTEGYVATADHAFAGLDAHDLGADIGTTRSDVASTVANSITFTVVRTRAEFEALEPEWNALFADRKSVV